MKFKTVYTAHGKHVAFTEAGEKDRPNYKPQYAPNGTYELVEDGVIHSYDDVQAWLPQTDMGQIIERYIKTGDTQLLQRRAAFYGDTTNMPKNYGELHNCLQNADNIFMSLPLEVREAFGNSPAVFYANQDKANKFVSEFAAKNQKAAESVSTPLSGTSVQADIPAVEVKGSVE